jgi:multidrug efflux pump subunit AcrA (membrane-fusion protein)
VNVQIAYGKLTYRDVRKILALLDAWPSGSIHFEEGGLAVDAITNRADAQLASEVPSPAVGIFRAQSGDSSAIGRIDAPTRSTTVVAPDGARVVARLVDDGAFVEYGQPLVLVMR